MKSFLLNFIVLLLLIISIIQIECFKSKSRNQFQSNLKNILKKKMAEIMEIDEPNSDDSMNKTD